MKPITVKFGECAEIVNGFAFRSELFSERNTGLPVVRIRDVVRGHSETFYTGSYPESAVVSNGDLLVGMDGEFNVAQWRGGKALLNQRVCKIVPRTGVSDRAFLKHALSRILKRIEDATPFVTVKHLSSEELKEETLTLPPLSEQQQITGQLEQADRLRRTRRYALELTNTFLPAAFLQLFGDPVRNPRAWERARVCDLGRVETGSTPPREDKTSYGDAIEWIKSDNITLDSLHPARATEMLSERGAGLGTMVDVGSLLVTCIAGSMRSIGNVVITDRRVAFNQQINAITPGAGVVPLFLYGLLLVAKPLIQRSSTEAMKRMITKSKLEELVLIKPPLPLQQQFAALVERVERLRSVQRESLRQAEHLFQSLLYRAFNTGS
jgi:type I restriction enzyme, S subunit